MLLDIQHLQEYVKLHSSTSVVPKVNDHSMDTPSKEDWLKILGDDYDEICFSNYKRKQSDYYTLLFTKQHIQLIEHCSDVKKIWIYDYDTKDITVNNELLPHLKQQLGKKISVICKAVTNKTANAFAKRRTI